MTIEGEETEAVKQAKARLAEANEALRKCKEEGRVHHMGYVLGNVKSYRFDAQREAEYMELQQQLYTVNELISELSHEAVNLPTPERALSHFAETKRLQRLAIDLETNIIRVLERGKLDEVS